MRFPRYGYLNVILSIFQIYTHFRIYEKNILSLVSVNFFGSLLLTLRLAFEEFATMEVIEHYKKKLLRHIEDPDTVLYCLKKLDAVPVTIEILQDSEVGKVVNRLKKRTDTTPDVISSSKALVEKWKELVKNADEADEVQKPQKVSVNEVKIVSSCLIFFYNLLN